MKYLGKLLQTTIQLKYLIRTGTVDIKHHSIYYNPYGNGDDGSLIGSFTRRGWLGGVRGDTNAKQESFDPSIQKRQRKFARTKRMEFIIKIRLHGKGVKSKRKWI